MNKKRKLPTGLFHHPGSKNLYFKIKKWDEEKEKWVWSSPISSQTTDVALALKTREEAQALSNEIAPNDPASFNQDKAYALVNTILRWHGVPEITKRRAPSWSEAKSGWLDNQKRKLEAAERVPGKDPLAQYRVSLSRLKLFDGYLGSRNPKLSDIHREDAQGFYWDLIEQGYQPSTVLQSVKLLKRIFDQAREDGHIDRNPWAKLETKGNQYRQKEPFSLDDIRKIWANLDKLEHPEEWRTVVLFGLVLGARLKDCTLRTWEEVVLMDPPHIQFHPGKTQKRGIVVKAPLVNPLLDRLHRIAGDAGGYITPHLSQESTETLSAAFSGLLRDIGIPMRKEKGLKTWYSKGFHSWRHTLPSLLAANDVPQEIRMAITGHTDKDTHHQYTHHEDTRLRGVLEESMRGIVLL